MKRTVPKANVGLVLANGVAKLLDVLSVYVPKCACGDFATYVSIQKETKICDSCFKLLPLAQRRRSLSGLKLWIEIPDAESIRYAVKTKKWLKLENLESKLN
jgi:hypothetical protein